MIIRVKIFITNNKTAVKLIYRDFATGNWEENVFKSIKHFNKYCRYVYSRRLRSLIKKNIKNLAIREFYIEL